MPIDKLVEIARDNVYMEICRYCHKAKKCHLDCINCDDYEEQVINELKRLRKWGKGNWLSLETSKPTKLI